MRTLKLLAVSIVAALVAGGAWSASTFASTPRLAITWDGALYEGTTINTVTLQVSDSVQCWTWYNGSTTTNKYRDVDTLTGPNVIGNYCVTAATGVLTNEYAITSALQKFVLPWNGQDKAVGTITIKGPGPCVYLFKEMMGTQASGYTFATGTVHGSVVQKESNISCAPIETLTLDQIGVGYPIPQNGTYVPLQTELRL
jgi:hypothetical protein